MKIKKSNKKGTEDFFKVEELEPRLELGYVDSSCGNTVNVACDNNVDAVCGGGGGSGHQH